MKYMIIIFLALNILSVSLYGQKRDDNWRIEEAGTTSPSFENITYYKKQVLPFRDIIVLDKRYDSSKAGYANVLAGRSKYSRIVPKQSWSVIINNYFKKNLDPASSQSLVFIIRSFWIQRGAIEELTSKKVVTKAAFGSTDFGGNCKAAIDVYVQTDSSLQPLFQVDTSFISLISNFNKNTVENFFFLPFDSVARKIATLKIEEVISRKRKLSWKEVNDHYSSRLNFPVLTEQSINKGIYFTFNDFKNNKPYATSIRFREGKLTDELYITENGKEELVVNYWGFCDNEGNLYIKSGFNAFKAIRQQNTFELYGAKYVSNYHNNPAQGDIRISSYSLDEKILQVNMDNGKLF
jgi:hypothetical protein